ncbi:MAG: hypothetical protein AAB425_07965, partial [Bdellovibrionota bacterium]
DHAFAHYFAALCHSRLGNQKEFEEFRRSFLRYSATAFWKKYCELYGLSLENLDSAPDSVGVKASGNFEGHGPDARLARKFGP